MQVFVWGETSFQTFNTPVETEVQSLDEAFCVFGTGAMYKAIHIGIVSIFNHYYHSTPKSHLLPQILCDKHVISIKHMQSCVLSCSGVEGIVIVCLK